MPNVVVAEGNIKGLSFLGGVLSCDELLPRFIGFEGEAPETEAKVLSGGQINFIVNLFAGTGPTRKWEEDKEDFICFMTKLSVKFSFLGACCAVIREGPSGAAERRVSEE